ncbi:MAG TPA: helix-turn-helix domain-containing protein [Firmicutes bacterium]|nr:helix-turn-helix domain-containing protein [Bacillota bacterium]
MSLGAKIAEYRKERGLTLQGLAGQIGISFSYLSAIERDLKRPSLRMIHRISEALNVPPGYLLSDAPETRLEAKLKLIREGRGLGLADLAEASGISQEHLAELEAGQARPTLEEIHTLAEALDVTAQYFLERGTGSTGIGSRVAQVRTAQRLTLAELAQKSGVSPSMLSQLENDRVVPSLETLEKVADALHVSVCYFLMDQEEVQDLLSTLSPEVRELLRDPRVQGVLRAVRDFSTGEMRYTLNQIEFIRKNRNLLQ